MIKYVISAHYDFDVSEIINASDNVDNEPDIDEDEPLYDLEDKLADYLDADEVLAQYDDEPNFRANDICGELEIEVCNDEVIPEIEGKLKAFKFNFFGTQEALLDLNPIHHGYYEEDSYKTCEAEWSFSISGLELKTTEVVEDEITEGKEESFFRKLAKERMQKVQRYSSETSKSHSKHYKTESLASRGLLQTLRSKQKMNQGNLPLSFSIVSMEYILENVSKLNNWGIVKSDFALHAGDLGDDPADADCLLITLESELPLSNDDRSLLVRQLRETLRNVGNNYPDYVCFTSDHFYRGLDDTIITYTEYLIDDEWDSETAFDKWAEIPYPDEDTFGYIEKAQEVAEEPVDLEEAKEAEKQLIDREWVKKNITDSIPQFFLLSLSDVFNNREASYENVQALIDAIIESEQKLSQKAVLKNSELVDELIKYLQAFSKTLKALEAFVE